MVSRPDAWPILPLSTWKDTCDTLHLWTQMVGKVKLALSPFANHWWHVPLYVGARGLATGAIPYAGGSFEMTFDFIDHHLRFDASDGTTARMALCPRSVADFYREFTATLRGLRIDAAIWPVPVEMPDHRVRFDQDETHDAYDADAAHKFWRMLLVADQALKEFRSSFIGKCSPVHFFWGSFDLAVTRFSGRRAPERKDADPVTREAYSHEVSSAGFWPGGGPVPDAAFYAYAAPEPAGFKTASIQPPRAFYSPELSIYVFMYEDARTADSPTRAIYEFLESTYAAGANLANWNRADLERAAAPVPIPVRSRG
jgi:hypothetical protein